mgnify:CR=1 FL=1
MPTVLEDVEIFRTGSYPQGNYDVQDIDAIVNNYDPDFFEAPTSTDHRQSGPAYGWVKQLRRKDNIMYADVEVSDELAKALQEKKFANRSVEFVTLPEKGEYLKALTFLGIKMPQVKGLAPIDFSKFEDSEGTAKKFDLTSPDSGKHQEESDRTPGSSSFLQFASGAISKHIELYGQAKQFGEELGNFLKEKRDELGLTNADLAEAAEVEESTIGGILSGEIENPPDERLEGLAELIDEPLEELQAMLSDSSDEVVQLVEKLGKSFMDTDAERKQAAERLDQLMVERRKNDFEAFLSEAIATGRLAPAAKEKALTIMEALDSVPRSFADSQDENPIETFKNMITSLPKQFSDTTLLAGNKNPKDGNSTYNAVAEEHAKSKLN